jgi:DNA-binding PadR family transcriptional regulator
MEDKSISKHLPLTEATYYILLALVTPKHGYAVMQEAEEISQGTLRLAPGTIYGAFKTLEESKLISMVGKEGRRKMFQISETGIRVLLGQIQRMEIMLQSAGKNFDLWQQVSAEEE